MNVPQSQQTIRTDRTAQGYLNNSVPAQAFIQKNDVSRAFAYATKAVSGVLDDMLAKQTQDEQNKILDYVNQYNQFCEPLLYDKDNGYYMTSGKNAVDGYDGIYEQMSNKATDLIDEANLSKEGTLKLKTTLDSIQRNHYQGMNKHADKERQIYQQNVIADTLNDTNIKGVHNRYNDEQLSVNIKDVDNASYMYAQTLGYDDITTKNLVQKNRENFHTGVINGYIADNNYNSIQCAINYLEKYKENLSPDNYSKYSKTLKSLSLDYKADEEAKYLITKDENAALADIDKIREKDMDYGEKVESSYNRLKKRFDDSEKAKKQEIVNQYTQNIFDAMQIGTPEQKRSVYTSIMNNPDLDADTKLKLIDFAKKAESAEGIVTNEVHKQLLEDMAFYNADEFKNIDLLNYTLAKDDYERFSKLQREIGSEAYTQQADLKKAVDTMSVNFPFFANFGDRLKKPYVTDMVGLLSEIERKHGRAFSFSVGKNNEISGSDKNVIKNYLEAFGYKKEDVKDKEIDEVYEIYNKLKQYRDFNNNYLAGKISEFERANKRLPSGDDLYKIVYSSYQEFELKKQQLAKDNMVKDWTLFQSVANTNPKYGETKVLTYFADTRLKQYERELGFKITCVNGSRYRVIDTKRSYISDHTYGSQLDVSISEHNPDKKIAMVKKMLDDPLVNKIATSDKTILEHFKDHPDFKTKIVNMNSWDSKTGKKNKVTHSNHLHLQLNTKFGGKEQGQVTVEQQKQKVSAVLKNKGYSDKQINDYFKRKGLA